ncbi:factor 3 subunit F [Seminavis robusta]|uniref:Eukaryotic translation initiation factor 3 subunit F n=1 Tax=Seminavis robusta TaxID=568900 RepID=A0A9N8HPK9_9STRA|nr:factor 3 subunit F [Seminavis robusta]|eukprot:Sro909_g219030.1 factor 3 subunit F (304) ;mRNA; f:30466-31482
MASQTAFSSSGSIPALLLEDDPEVVSHLVVHPLVLLHVLDHHTRRQETDGRVIGTLLGRRDGDKIEVTNCFAVPHAERGDEVAIGKDFNKQMLALYNRTNRKETVVGWYASAALSEGKGLIADTSSLIHEFYAGESDEGDPVHLVVDTRMQTDSIAIRAFRSTPVTVLGEPLANLFHEVRLSLQSTEPETICLNQMTKSHDNNNSTTKQKEDLALQVSMEKLYSLLDTALQYVDSVVEGKVNPDPEVGRQIADTLACVPRVRPEVFDRLFNDSLQDLLMVTYLSNITRTQLAVAEKLNASLGV